MEGVGDALKHVFGMLLSMAQRIALTRRELRNTVGAHWRVLRAQALYSRLSPRQNAVSPSPSANLRVSDEERLSNVLRRAACQRVQEDTIMKKRIACLLAFVLAVMLVPAALPQTESTPIVYTYVSQFQIPRANWAAYSEDTEKSFVPVVEKSLADGAILNWSTFEQVVHTPDGFTHGAAWSSTSLAGLMKVLDEVRKNGPRPGQIAATRHEDYLMQSTMYRGGSGTPAYLRVVCSNAKADKPEAYTAMLKKMLVPTFDEQIKAGAATYYGVDEQYVNNGAPSTRCLVMTYPSAEGMDKWATAINTTIGKWSAAERAEFTGATVPDSRRDIMARITHS